MDKQPTVNVLDRQRAAAELYRQVYLEVQFLRDQLNYEFATSWCDDCPGRMDEQCCKNNEDWGARELEHIAHCDQLLKALKVYAGDAEINRVMGQKITPGINDAWPGDPGAAD